MADQYGHQLPDLGRLATGRTHFPVNQETPQPYFFNRSINNETVMLAAGEMVLPAAGGLVRFGHHHDFAAAATNHPTTVVDMESSGWGNTNESGNGRWPRQETLTLLEIRSRLDSKFKEANHKKPLWDEVSRYQINCILFLLFYVSCIYIIISLPPFKLVLNFQLIKKKKKTYVGFLFFG